MVLACQYWHCSLCKGAPPLSSLDKEKDIDFDLLQDLMDVDIDPLDIDLEKDPLAAKVFKVGFYYDTVSLFSFVNFFLTVFSYITICFIKNTMKNVKPLLPCG